MLFAVDCVPGCAIITRNEEGHAIDGEGDWWGVREMGPADRMPLHITSDQRNMS